MKKCIVFLPIYVKYSVQNNIWASVANTLSTKLKFENAPSTFTIPDHIITYILNCSLNTMYLCVYAYFKFKFEMKMKKG